MDPAKLISDGQGFDLFHRQFAQTVMVAATMKVKYVIENCIMQVLKKGTLLSISLILPGFCGFYGIYVYFLLFSLNIHTMLDSTFI